MFVQYLHRIARRFYAAQLNEYIPPGLRSQVFVMRVTGVWPTPTDSYCYKWVTFIFFCWVGILNPLLQFVNIFFATSVQDAMDYSFLSLTCFSTAAKAAIIYRRRDNIRQLFRIHVDLLRRAGRNENHYDPVARMNCGIHMFIGAIYVLCWVGFLVQCIFAKPYDRMWPSTTRWPYKFARYREAYWAVLIQQAFGNLGMTIWGGIEDAFYVGLMNTTCGHLNLLKTRLMVLGTETVATQKQDLYFFAELVKCCKRYEECSRCGAVRI